MTIPRRPEDGPFHQRHSCKPNTDAALVAAFLSSTPMHDCGPYGATITGEACRKRRRIAFSAPRRAYKHNIRDTWKTDILMQVDKCLKCTTYYKPAPAPVPAKYGTCSDCGKEKRLVGRGKCSSCYQRYRKGRAG